MIEHDDDILRGLVSGDAHAAHQVTTWARDAVRARAFRVPPGDWDDLAQAVVLDVLRAAHAPGFRLRKPLLAFVRHVAAARCVDAMRRTRPTVEITEALPDAARTPYEELLARDRHAQVRWALQQLGDACREVIRLHFDEGLPYADIARRLGGAEATMRVRMFNCLKQARAWIGRWQVAGLTTAQPPEDEG